MPLDHFGLIAPIFSRVGYSSADTMLEMADLPVSGRLLDVGGGTGRVADLLQEHVDEVVIADPSLGMLRQADPARHELACANSEAMPFPDESFERIIIVDALHHVFDQRETARDMYRLLKPGGRIVIEEPDVRTFPVKLIALAEKMLLMRSHFLEPSQILELFSFNSAKTRVNSAEGNAWIVIEKP